MVTRRFRIWLSCVWLLAMCMQSLGAAGSPASDTLTVRMSADDTRHLLARTGIGVAPADFLHYRDLTRQQAIDRLLTDFATQPSLPMPAWIDKPVPHYHARQDMDDNERAIFNNERDAELGQLRSWWVQEMLSTPTPQTERMVLFWHDLFATSYYDTDRQSLAMARQNQTFREFGMGSWEVLLKAMIRDPALLEFLNAGSNHKDSPNENLARELLELFTLGEGNYDETVVREAARALTGHNTVRRHDLSFRLESWKHDHGVKRLFNVSGKHQGDDLIDIVLAQPAAARFLAQRFWQAFIAHTPAEEAWLQEHAKLFRASGYDIASLYRAVLESPAFWRDAHRGAMIKSPVDLIAGTARSLEYPKHHWPQMSGWHRMLGMELFAPPNVAGWKEGGAFITPGRLLDRYTLMRRLIAPIADDTAQMSSSMNAMSMAEDPGDAPVDTLLVRLAGEDYQGAVEYQISVREGDAVLWQSDKLVLKQGRDTERDGRVANFGELNWQTQRFDIADNDRARATHIDVAFLNDAAGAAGDRNLYVDGITFNDQWFSGSRASQVSGCSPALPVNAWKLYCNGFLRFDIGATSELNEPVALLPEWRAAAVHVGWANSDNDSGRQTVYLTLDDVSTPIGHFNSLQFSVVTRTDEPSRLRLESYGCWPSCISEWPACAWHDPHFPQNRTLSFVRKASADAFWQSDEAPACHYQALDDDQKSLVNTLWQSVEPLLLAVQNTHRAQQFGDTLKQVHEHLSLESVALENTPYSKGASVMVISPDFAFESSRPASLADISPVLTSRHQLQALLASEDIAVQHLLMPSTETGKGGSLPLQQWLEYPEFQLK